MSNNSQFKLSLHENNNNNSINNLLLGNDNIFPPIHMILDNTICDIQKYLVFF